MSWNESAKSTVLSSFFWGYLITQVYAGQMAQKYGGKNFLTGALIVSGFLTIITPATAIHGGVVAMCINRMVQGMAQVSLKFKPYVIGTYSGGRWAGINNTSLLLQYYPLLL